MTIKNFAEWKEAVKREYDKFSDMYPYLNEAGMDVYKALSDLRFMSDIYSSASEMADDFAFFPNTDNISFIRTSIYYTALVRVAAMEDEEEG